MHLKLEDFKDKLEILEPTKPVSDIVSYILILNLFCPEIMSAVYIQVHSRFDFSIDNPDQAAPKGAV